MFTTASRERKQIELVKQIHEEFDSASERLVAHATQLLSQDAQEERAERLKRLGFVAQTAVKENDELAVQKTSSRKTCNLIAGYAERYPGYKFITRDEVQRICKKYGLVVGEAKQFIGDIPERNLRDIEAFHIQTQDMAYYMTEYRDQNGRHSVTALAANEWITRNI